MFVRQVPTVLLLWTAVTSAQDASNSAVLPMMTIPSASSIARIINETGLIPPDVLDLASQFLANLVNSTSIALTGALSQQGVDPEKLSDPEVYYSYGRSPPVYPSPEGAGRGDWEEAYSKARKLVANMTNEEKNAIVSPAEDDRQCAGMTGNVTRLGFSGICLNDGPSGFRREAQNGSISGFPAQLSIGASWDRSLAYSRAIQMGKEFKAKGVNVALAPVVGPLGRVAKGGRNWEGFGADPYLSGQLVQPAVSGLQENVIACVKHFIGNEQESNRNPFLQGLIAPLDVNLNNSVSSNIDDRTMHELYLSPFYDAVRAGVGSVMASYQRINNSYGCQNSKTMNGLLKTELGFQGFTVSDWYGQHTGVASAEAGLDMVMPSDVYWGDNTLATAVSNGSMNATRLDDMATRVLAAWYRFAPFEEPGVEPHLTSDSRDADSALVAFQAAVEGHVLVKNINNALPLDRPARMSVFGYDAIGGLNSSTDDAALYPIGLTNTRMYTNGADFGDLETLMTFAAVSQAGSSIPEIAWNGTLFTGGGSGASTPSGTVSPFDALTLQAAKDDTKVHTDFLSQDPDVMDIAGPCLVFINAQSSESADRSTLADEYSDTLISNVASKCSNTIVIIHNAGIRLVDRWIDNDNITAVIYAHVPGQASGDAIVELLYGRQSPSGRLPYTVAHQESDYGNLLGPDLPTAEDPQYSQSDFEEGVFIDYRHFIQNKITPRFEFGYGLTYTTFSYSGLSITTNNSISRDFAPPDADATTPPPEGGLASLYDIIATATITVTNNGTVAAAEVAQLYLNIPNSGVERQLRGFEKQMIQPGENATYNFPLRRRDLSNWDVERQTWMMQEGEYGVMVGKSVLDVQLQARFEVQSNGSTGDGSGGSGGGDEGAAGRLRYSSLVLTAACLCLLLVRL